MTTVTVEECETKEIQLEDLMEEHDLEFPVFWRHTEHERFFCLFDVIEYIKITNVSGIRIDQSVGATTSHGTDSMVRAIQNGKFTELKPGEFKMALKANHQELLDMLEGVQ